ncbi:hypothetical protein [Actinomycetospora sp. TBRC 11914]|uniref:hypothetical protein n=1 Tax=Actinomycetospora sp. TBRC 11914 TaxID=2729387 RepID=UPI00145F48D3|nr:hypothetical protein [Actinomycetospora sp. TBRC 11914]NMO90245.1 hypothetical protein [Actinomycetospora sp. TBRC 11914]
MTWVALLMAALFLITGVVRALRPQAEFTEALIDTAIGLGAGALGVSELIRGPAVGALVGLGLLGLLAGSSLLLGRRLRARRPPRDPGCSTGL